MSDHRSGVVALLGLPNAGKSTLLNRWVGERLAIVTRRPQTTRTRLLGILTRPGVQALLLDTPGLPDKAVDALGEAMGRAVAETAAECDVAVLLVDGARGWQPAHDEILALVGDKPCYRVATQADRSRVDPDAGWDHVISARTGQGCAELLDAVLEALPEGPLFFPEDEITDRPLRFLAAELIREAAFDCLGEELPYGVAVEIESFDESRADLVRIRARLLVDRESHKAMVIGAGGRKIKQIGTRARHRIERLLDCRVHLELWVKPEPGWAKKPRRLRALGYL